MTITLSGFRAQMSQSSEPELSPFEDLGELRHAIIIIQDARGIIIVRVSDESETPANSTVS